MSRLLPKSLFGQTLLILLGGLILSHAVGSWIYTMDREQAVRAVGGFAAAQRIALVMRLSCSYPAGEPVGSNGGGGTMQKAQPRDIGALALVVALFVVLFVLSVTLGAPPR